MKAIAIDGYGDAGELRAREAPDPKPDNEGILIRVRAAGVNPLDWRIRQGQLRFFLHLRFPYVLGCDVAGEVVSTGILAKRFKAGDPVFAFSDPRRGGAYAELAVVNQAMAAPKPDSLDFTEAASLPIAGCTALQGLRDIGRVFQGAKVLIHGGAGGVGHFAVQIAKALGAETTATCGPTNIDFVRSLGAETVIDHTRQDFTADRDRYDVIFDTVGKSSFSACRNALAPGGTYVTTLPSPDLFFWGPVQRVAKLFGQAKQARLTKGRPNGEDLAYLGGLVEEGQLKPTVSLRFPLDGASEAHQASQASHARGKIALDLASTLPALKYRAFLSYSHCDTDWGKWFHTALEGYSVDKDLIGRDTPAGPIPRTLRPIFRDRDDFAAGPSLPRQTIEALEASQFLIVICSPNSARSEYVNEEVRRFKALGRAHKIIPVIVDGEPYDPQRECFPPALAFHVGPGGSLTDEREEPIAADARPNRDGKALAKLKVVAGVLGASLDEIVRRAEWARRRRLRNWTAALLALTVTFAGLTVWAEINRREATRESVRARENLSSALTALAFTELGQRPVNAAKLALAAWPRLGAKMPKREVTMSAVSQALSGLYERMRITTTNFITSVAFSPDGARILSGSWDGTAALWNAATGKKIRTFTAYGARITCVAFSSDGERVLTGSYDKTARLWDATTGQQIRIFKVHDALVFSVAFSPDGTRVLTGSDDNAAYLWDAETGDEIRAFRHEGYVMSVAFSSDGKSVLTGSYDTTARLWDASSGQQIRTFKVHDSLVRSVAFSPDGTRVLTGSVDNIARLWSADTGQEIRAFEGHKDQVTSVAFSPDGRRVLTGSDDKTARLWDVETGEEIRALTGHEAWIWSVSFGPDGMRVLTGSDDKTVRLWDAETAHEVRSFGGHGDRVTSVAFSRDGKLVLTGSYDKTARLWDAATGKEIRPLKGHEQFVTSVAFSRDGKLVLTGSYDTTARMWDAATAKEIHRFKGHEQFVTSVAFSPNGGYVLTGSSDKTARLWDAATGKEIRPFKGHEQFVTSVAFSPNGDFVLTGSSDKTARLWDTETGREIRAFRGHEEPVLSVAFSPDNSRVLTGSADGTARIWSAVSGEEMLRFKGPENVILSVAFSPDGTRVLTGSSDKNARLWDAATAQEIHAFKGHDGIVVSVAFSVDGTRMLTGSDDKTARLWDISAIPKGSIFDIACAWLPDHDLSDLGKGYGLDLSSETSICQKDASGRFTTPLPESAATK